MKKYLLILSSFILFQSGSFAQAKYIRAPSIGISFIFNDYETPDRIKATSIRQVLKEKQWAGLNEMSPGLAITYFKGLHPKVDFAATLAGSFVDDALPERTADNAFLMEGDAVLHLKMLTDRYLFTPYLIAGVGASKFNGYFGAYMPMGGGFKVNFFDEASFFINAKYHLPVTTATVRRHFVYSMGIAGVIGKRKDVL